VSWITRDSFPSGRAAKGLLLITPEADVVVPLSARR
jgi:hypothetical protein